MPRVGFQPIQEVEDWIEQNQCVGKQTVIKLLCEEDDGENFYTCRVEAVRYEEFAISRYKTGFVVTHIKTGGRCHHTFSSEKSARRLIFCIKGLTNWKKVDWTEEELHISPDLMEVCSQAISYCEGDPGDYYSRLIEAVEAFMLDDDDFEAKAVPVGFGLGEEEPEPVIQVQEPPKSIAEWGT